MENATLGYAFSRSFQIIKNNWWFTIGVAIVTEIIIGAAMFSIAVPVMIITWATTSSFTWPIPCHCLFICLCYRQVIWCSFYIFYRLLA